MITGSHTAEQITVALVGGVTMSGPVGAIPVTVAATHRVELPGLTVPVHARPRVIRRSVTLSRQIVVADVLHARGVVPVSCLTLLARSLRRRLSFHKQVEQ